MKRAKYAVYAMVLAGLVWSLRLAALGPQPLVGDGPMYLAMAGGAEGEPPWSFHVLTPRLAGYISPRNPAAGFFAIAMCSFILTAGTVAALLEAGPLRASPGERLFGAALFMAVYPGVAMYRAYFMVDSLSYALLAVACLAAVHRRDGLLALVTLIGIFNRETALFVAPVWLAINFLDTPLVRLAVRSVLVFGPTLAGYVLLHHTPLFFGHFPAHFNYVKHADLLWTTNLSWLGTGNVAYGLAICVFLAYGPAWFVAGYGYYHSLTRRGEAVRSLLPLGALAVPTLLALPVVDWRRGFQPLFPAVIAASVVGLRAATAGLSRAYWCLAAVGTVLAANFTTEAWWARKISVPVTISMSLWVALMAFLVSRRPTQESGRGLGSTAHGSVRT